MEALRLVRFWPDHFLAGTGVVYQISPAVHGCPDLKMSTCPMENQTNLATFLSGARSLSDESLFVLSTCIGSTGILSTINPVLLSHDPVLGDGRCDANTRCNSQTTTIHVMLLLPSNCESTLKQ